MSVESEDIRSDVPFVLACVDCDADGPDTYAEAIREGWINIRFDDGPGWYYLGICPQCWPGYGEVLLPLVCKTCGRKVMLAGYNEARDGGWTEVSSTPDLEKPSFLGTCAECLAHRCQ